METFWVIVVYAFLFGTGALVGWVMYQLSPFAHHADDFGRLGGSGGIPVPARSPAPKPDRAPDRAPVTSV